MNKIGIIGAMEVEIRTLKETMQILRTEIIAEMEFCEGVLYGKQVVVVRSGIGKVNAAVCTQILVDKFQVDCVVNTGIAGGVYSEINIGDIVISIDALQHDMDAVGFGYEIGVIPQMKHSTFVADSKLVEMAKEVCEEVNSDITTYVGRVVTGDQFISSREKKKWLQSTFNAYCAEMEGAAIAQVSYLNQIPFVIIRAISDKADSTACGDYQKFEEQAVKHAVNLVCGMLKKM